MPLGFSDRILRVNLSSGSIDVEQSELKEAPEYPTLVKALWTLGHLGEGHCEVSKQSSKAEIR